MTSRNWIAVSTRRGLVGVAAAAGALMLAGVAQAGECPADKVMANSQKPGPAASQGVTDKVVGSIDLATEGPKVKDHQFRLRRLVVEPGGVVAWHSHGERPAIIYIVSGSIVEYRSTCAEPITHKAGETAIETHATQHWWKNATSEPVELLSADILHEKSDHKMM